MRCEIGGHIAAVLWSAASMICSKHHATALCSSNLAFPPSVLFDSQWCSCTIVQTRSFEELQFYFIKITFAYDHNLFITVCTLPVLTSLSVDEILLPRYRY